MLRALSASLAAILFWSSTIIPASAGEPEPSAPACGKDVPPALAPHWDRICHGEKRNRVIDHMHGGLAALVAGHTDLSERSLDEALEGIETVYADTPQAEKARSLWHAEDVKDFKGEPYERSMAYYYRGLLALMRADYDLAQAAFQGGVLQDTFAETERYRADVGSLVWLEAWANRCRGNMARAEERFAEAQTINPKLAPPPANHTLLFIVESGQGPRKFRAGPHGSVLGIREGFIGNYALAAKVGTQVIPLNRAEDLFFQATTRGGRGSDKILAEKAAAKDTGATLGTAMMAGGLVTAGYNTQSNRNNNDAAAAGLAVALVGLMIYAASQEMEPGADTRTWITLPHSLHIASAPAQDLGNFTLIDPAGRDVLADRKAVQMVTASSCSLVWVGAHAVTPSLALAASSDGGAGNCRTSSGSVVTMAPPTCQQIGGQVLGAETGLHTIETAAGAATRFSTTCQTSNGTVSLDAVTCTRIGGTPH